MASVVSFNCDNGPRNIISDKEDGLLVTNGDTKELAAKINQMIEHQELRQSMGQAAYQHAARYEEENIFAQYIDLYSNIVKHE